ncbi:MAG TPA: type I restriction-modification system subunit M [Oligoflexia bacterium]|nr:type I restriction-modification system subunit M [Oligoflexia bacterium]HMR24684.1 type I restriction-modification system subunit M [Oligoflexia bacterium]
MTENKKVTQSDVNKIAWKACDTFRGVVDPAQYKDYILSILFFKYLSDIWRDKQEQYSEQFGGDESKIERFMSRERFIIPIGASFYDVYERRNDPNIGEILNKALMDIEDHPSNKAKLEGMFRNIDFNSEVNLGSTKERNQRIKHLLEDFGSSQMDLRPSHLDGQDIIGNTYEYLISNFASSAAKKGGEFFTPKEVSILLAKLVQPKKGERICDPTAGSGSLLIRVAQEIGSDDFALYGQESNVGTWALSKMNMFLHGIDGARMERGDTLRNPKLIEDDHLVKYDVVVANPPFSLDKWGAEIADKDPFERFHRGVPPKSKGDYAFITHMVESINEHGRVGVIVPHGVLFRGSSEGRIREQLIKENLLDAVIGLPSKLFFGTGIPAAILLFKKGKKTEDVIFIDASREFEEGTKQNQLTEKHIEKIVNTYKDRKDLDKYAHVASLDEIERNDFNLNIPRYVDTFEEEEEIDIKAVQGEIEKIEEELAEVRSQMKKYLKELGI